MYTILDEQLDRQLAEPIVRRQPKETCAQSPRPAGLAPFEPWKIPFPDEQEWRLFLELMLGALHDAPEEAKRIFDTALHGVCERIGVR